MSLQEAHRFLEKVNEDSDLQKKLQEVGANFTSVAKAHGFDFTQDELSQKLHERWKIPGKQKGPKDPDTPDTCFFG